MEEKKLIFKIFRPIDLVIFVNGLMISLMLLMIFSSMDKPNTFMIIISLFPVVIGTILVMPLKKYHNVLEAIKQFIKGRK